MSNYYPMTLKDFEKLDWRRKYEFRIMGTGHISKSTIYRMKPKEALSFFKDGSRVELLWPQEIAYETIRNSTPMVLLPVRWQAEKKDEDRIHRKFRQDPITEKAIQEVMLDLYCFERGRYVAEEMK